MWGLSKTTANCVSIEHSSIYAANKERDASVKPDVFVPTGCHRSEAYQMQK